MNHQPDPPAVRPPPAPVTFGAHLWRGEPVRRWLWRVPALLCLPPGVSGLGLYLQHGWTDEVALRLQIGLAGIGASVVFAGLMYWQFRRVRHSPPPGAALLGDDQLD